jgi:hypothetical protein
LCVCSFEKKTDNNKKNFDLKTKVWDKIPTERETYYLSLSHGTYQSFLKKADENFQKDFKALISLSLKFIIF